MKALIPTNIITGFLGVGKTTSIKHLLNIKPDHETWSVLVNEFGEIGIDGAMLKGTNAHIREVPGGCLCCVGGLPMKVALNMLIATTKPDRIIIEPTGLGHPEEIVNTLTGEYYNTVLDLRATLTLVDPRKLSDKRYTDNENFQDQIAIADVLVANKTDLCTTQDKENFTALTNGLAPEKQISFFVTQGELELAWLDYARTQHDMKNPQHHKREFSSLNPQRDIYNMAVALPDGENFICRENQSEGAFSCGWLFSPKIQFDFNKLFGWLSSVDYWRAKAVMHTDQGVYIFNTENGVLSVNNIDINPEDILDSRIELIDDKKIEREAVEAFLLSTIL